MKVSVSLLFDDRGKNLTRQNKNYYFGATLLIVLLNIVIFAVYGFDTGSFSVSPDWNTFSVANLFQALVNTYSHFNWQHVLLNMLCFFVAGLYLERKQGSLKFLAFILIMSLFTAFASCTNDISLAWGGFSGVNYGLYGYILVEFVFEVCRKNCDSFNAISGAVVIALIYLAMCFNGGTKNIGFEWYPHDLLHNLGHASGFVVGLIFGAYEQICSLLGGSSQ